MVGIRRLAPVCVAAVLAFAAMFQSRAVHLEDFTLDAGLTTNGVPWLAIVDRTNYYGGYQVEISTNLANWNTFGTFLNLLAPYRDSGAIGQAQRYFRAFEVPTPAYTNQVVNQITPWTFSLSKFLIFTNDPQQVYFHAGNLLHYDAARRHFPELAKLGPEGFDEKAIHPAHQDMVLGGILVEPAAKVYGIEFVSAEPYSPARLVELFKTVTNRIELPDYEPFLVPSSAQLDVAVGNLDYFKRQGVPIRQWKDFLTNSAIQSEGWTIGTLKYIPSKDLDAAIASGRLTPDTILLTDQVPRDLPPIAGLISLTASSPNSHTVFRLASHALPYYDLPTALTDLTNLIGQKVLFSAQFLTSRQYVDRQLPWLQPAVQIYLLKIDDVPSAVRTELLARQQAIASQKAPAMERAGVYWWKNTDLLTPADAKYFGSKAAHYGLLRKAIPEASEPAIALSFDLWLDFMAQKLPSGKTLRATIDEAIAGATNSTLLSERLKNVRQLITDTAHFTDSQRENILSVLTAAPFDPKRKIRFRSSSNAEDLPGFSAAGLYDSYSGCVLDDLRGTNPKTCFCDPADDKARSVFRAIQKVYASFYNEQAFLERKQYGIDEKTVGMAVLVHHSFPDEMELANGVADLVGQRVFNQVGFAPFRIASQRGALSVANPDGPDLPELFERKSPSEPGHVTQYSTVRPRNTLVLGSEAEYSQLLQLFSRVGMYFDPLQPFRLNFEFKKTLAGLIVKQVRPLLAKTTTKPTLLMPQDGEWETYQGGGVYANFGRYGSIESTHALKSRWRLNFRGGLTADTFQTMGGLTQLEAIYLKGDRVVSNTFVYASSLWITNGIENGWTFNQTSQPVFGVRRSRYVSTNSADRFDLDFLFQSAAGIATPFINPDDVMIQVSAPGTTNVAELVPKMAWLDAYVRTNVVSTNNVKITSIYTLGVHPRIPVVGLGPTSGLVEWKETEIAGFTSEPFRLAGSYSQTYAAARHNFTEYFLFEPGLEPDLPQKIRDELTKARIKQIYVTAHTMVWNPSFTESTYVDIVELVDFNGVHRKL